MSTSSYAHSQRFDSLPRPVPVKPAAFAAPSAVSSSAAVSSSSGPSTSGPSDNTISTTTSATAPATATATATTETNDKSDTHGTDPNRKRRGNLPKTVTSVLKSWLVQNAIHPYPTEDEKMRLSEATQLSMNQISNWFINARRRILQPILVEAAAAAVAGTDAPMDNVLIVRKGKGSRMQVEMECGGSSTQGQNQGQDQDQGQGQGQGQGQSQDQSQSQESGAKEPPA
ncbi:hypothetical protein BGZ79_009919 [Entomortierella chlamydospora]|nr:hypothetical protein BGZ79_009919 [Entomortierella chlamydospora]